MVRSGQLNSECQKMLLGNREHARDPVGSEQTLNEFRLFRDSNDYLYDIGEKKEKRQKFQCVVKGWNFQSAVS